MDPKLTQYPNYHLSRNMLCPILLVQLVYLEHY